MAFKSVHNLKPKKKEVKFNTILMFTCEKTHWALNTLLGFNTNTWNLNEMIVIFKKTTTLSSWACRKISVLLFLDRAPMGSGGKGGCGGCLSCGVCYYLLVSQLTCRFGQIFWFLDVKLGKDIWLDLHMEPLLAVVTAHPTSPLYKSFSSTRRSFIRTARLETVL